ncbi:MAG: hypothetical protein ACLVLH_21710 [Eisenbergiella massiliensis]
MSPIIGEVKSTAKITVGPFMMVDFADFIDCELTDNLPRHSGSAGGADPASKEVPQMPPTKVQELSVLLLWPSAS